MKVSIFKTMLADIMKNMLVICWALNMWGNVTLGGLTNFSYIFLWFTQETKVSLPIRVTCPAGADFSSNKQGQI